jgi:hypothetical protein
VCAPSTTPATSTPVRLPDAAQGSLRFDRGRADVTWTLYLVTGDAGARAATAALSDLLDKVAGLFPFTTFERVALALPGRWRPAAVLPADLESH